jgi:hypothetical protein
VWPASACSAFSCISRPTRISHTRWNKVTGALFFPSATGAGDFWQGGGGDMGGMGGMGGMM